MCLNYLFVHVSSLQMALAGGLQIGQGGVAILHRPATHRAVTWRAAPAQRVRATLKSPISGEALLLNSGIRNWRHDGFDFLAREGPATGPSTHFAPYGRTCAMTCWRLISRLLNASAVKARVAFLARLQWRTLVSSISPLRMRTRSLAKSCAFGAFHTEVSLPLRV